MQKVNLWAVTHEDEPSGFLFGGSYLGAKKVADDYYEEEAYNIRLLGKTECTGEWGHGAMRFKKYAKYTCQECESENLELSDWQCYECKDCGAFGDIEFAMN